MKIRDFILRKHKFYAFTVFLLAIFSFITLNNSASAQLTLITDKGKTGHVLAYSQTNSLRSLILSNSQMEHYLAPYMVRYQDEEDILDIQEIISAQHLKAKRSYNTGSISSMGIKGHTVWFGFDVMNRSDENDWTIDFGTSFNGRFGLFDDVKSFTIDKETGALTENKLHKDGIIYLDLPLEKKSQIVFQLSVPEGIPVTIPVRLLHPEKVPSSQNSPMLLFSMIFLIGFAFFFAAIALVKSNKNYLYFTLYYGILTLLLIIQNNYVVANIPLIGSEIVPFLILLAAISGFMVARLFWNMEDSSRFADIAFSSFVGLSLCAFAAGLALPIDLPILRTILFFLPSLLITILIPLISIAQSHQGNNEATPFMFGWFILLFGLCDLLMFLKWLG